jgi:hypothetical protein
MPTAFIESTSHHPNQHWYLLTAHRRRSRRPNVQVQTILGLRICVLKFWHKCPEDTRSVVTVLDADGLVRSCQMRTASMVGCFNGGLKAEVGSGRSAEGNAVPLVDSREGGVYEASVGTACGVYGEKRGSRVRTGLVLRECASQEGEHYVQKHGESAKDYRAMCLHVLLGYVWEQP